jgi:hypothetical protein
MASTPTSSEPRVRLADLTAIVPLEQWRLYQPAIEAALAEGPSFAVAGGLAFSAYSGRIRNTKDIDLCVRPDDRQRMIDHLTQAGFKDYYDQENYDRQWIYRGWKDGGIVDVIWQMANYRTEVDDLWLTRGPEILLHNHRIRLLPPEELIWSKLYVLQRERCDWPDLLNIFHAMGQTLDWNYLLRRIGPDAPVLGGLLNVFGWLCPEQARQFPARLWSLVGLRKPASLPDQHRVQLLDTRDWFG